ncbi:MAG: hypothetical protein GX962_08690 [Epulopiscium sp.]|nr:hypothetical protein [Candidatus Epulonipiscium sp.]
MAENIIGEDKAEIGIHALKQARFSALTEVVPHSKNKEDLILYEGVAAIFFEERWKKFKFTK